ncbi:MAG: tannase [Saccharofermentans sp.]|nr:tannase [Saccharofermentans sp.]
MICKRFRKQGKITALLISATILLGFTGCSSVKTTTDSTQAQIGEVSVIDNSKWNYNSDDNVYYQLGIVYCSSPADSNYENLAVFVPGDYMTASSNGDGTYTCSINDSATINGYTALTAPIVMPINTPGYSAQAALTSYTDVSDYTDAGFVYVHAGCRGREEGAPAGVTDLKAAIRYLRYSDNGIPGDTESIFTFGMSGGGAQSAIVGSTGDSSLYEPYLQQIGALSGYSDAVLGSMCWCPITNLDTADEAYEWMLGTTRTDLSDEEQQISDRLAEAYASYVNTAGIKDPNGNLLTLETSDNGIYQSGSYYEYIKTVIENSLNNFLADTSFPYDSSSSGMSGGGPAGGGGPDMGSMSDGEGPGSGESPDSAPGGSQNDVESADNITRNDTSSSGLSLTGTYETAQDYIDALNANGTWVTYDVSTNTATITSVDAFVNALKSASKNLGAFDQLDAGQGENTLFGYGDGSGAHFDAVLSQILNDLGNSYVSDYQTDLAKTDSAGNTVDVRLNMYTPLYYLLESQGGYGTSNVAKYWRIRTGINQGDCALTTEVNLALALENYSGVTDVDFETVWGMGHTQAERSGNSTDNFIAWVNECMNNK